MKKIIKIQGMMCPNCEKHVEKALMQLPGIESCKADHKKGRAELVFSKGAKPVEDEVMKKAIQDLDYEVLDIQEA